MMIKALACLAVGATALFSTPLAAEPITLKFSFFSSDREGNYLEAVKPFVDAVNASGFIHIDVYLAGLLARAIRARRSLCWSRSCFR
jgi:hypothetical protein